LFEKRQAQYHRFAVMRLSLYSYGREYRRKRKIQGKLHQKIKRTLPQLLSAHKLGKVKLQEAVSFDDG
jgi:hypothetical protein